MVVEPDRPGAEARGLARVVEIRHAAELDLHPYKDTGGWGLYLRLRRGRAVAERDGDGALLRSVDQGELDGVAGLLLVNRVDDVVHARHGLAVDGGDHVPPGPDLLPADRDGGLAAVDSGLVRGATGDDGLDERALLDPEVEHVRQLGRDVGSAD